MRPATTVAALAVAAAKQATDQGIRFLDRKEQADLWSWARIEKTAQGIAGALQTAGLKPGERLALVLPTGPDFVCSWFGVQLAGGVPVALYPPVRLGRLDEYFETTARMVQVSGSVGILTDSRLGRVLGRLLEKVRPRLGLREVSALVPAPLQPYALTPDHLAMVQFSSGTTVDPKPVALSHAQILANARAILDLLFEAYPEATFGTHAGVSWLPLYHDMGLIGCILPALDKAATLTLIAPEDFLARPALWLRAISRYGGTISPAPDFAYALCTERISDADLVGVDLSRWVAALNGAEPIRPATLRAFEARFRAYGLRDTALTPVYGLSEASLAVTFSPIGTPYRVGTYDRAALSAGLPLASTVYSVPTADVADSSSNTHVSEGGTTESPPATSGVELVSLGPPLPGMRVRICNNAGDPLPDGQIGRVQVRGDSVMVGYLDRPPEAQPFVDGWLDTGDLGFLSTDGLTLTGRAKDLIVVRGRNHLPQDLERAVDAVPGVRTGCAAAVADLAEGGERILLFVERREAFPDQAERCREAVRAATGVDPDLVVMLDPGTLPRTSSGKIRRGESLRRFLAGDLVPPEGLGPLRLAGTLARSAWARWSQAWKQP